MGTFKNKWNVEKSNNTFVTAPKAGQITDITVGEKGKTTVTIETTSGDTVTQVVPAGLDLSVKVADVVKADAPLTLDPNVGGFGQAEIGEHQGAAEVRECVQHEHQVGQDVARDLPHITRGVGAAARDTGANSIDIAGFIKRDLAQTTVGC